MATVIPHPSSDAGTRREQLRRRKATRRTDQQSALAVAERRLAESRRLPKPEPATLARNIGLIAEELSTDRKAARELLKRVFDDGLDPRWRKRLRWSRLAGEERVGEKYGSSGEDFVRLAAALAEAAPTKGMSKTDNRNKAIHMLLAGTKFDPDIGGIALVDIDMKRVLVERINQIRNSLIHEVRELPAYFARISDHSLTHKSIGDPMGLVENHFERDESTFQIWGWTQHGSGATGHLIPEALSDGYSLTEDEGTGLVATFPRVPLAEVTLTRHVPVLRGSDLRAAMPDLTPADWQNIDVIVDQVRARKLFPEVFPEQVEMPTVWRNALPVSKSWRIHMVAFPCGGRGLEDIQLGVVVEPISSAATGLEHVGIDYDTLDVRSSVAALSRDASDEGATWALLDVNALSTDPIWERLEEMCDWLWLATGDTALGVLAMKSSAFVQSGITSIFSVSRNVPSIMPLFEVPAMYTETPLVSLAGMIDRNYLFSVGENRLNVRLEGDAARRVETLWRQLNVEHDQGTQR